MTDVRRATPDDAAVLGRLLWDFNTEFETETDDADVLAARFARLLQLDEIVAVLAEDDGAAVGFALLSLRPAIWFDGPVSQLEELYVVPALRSRGSAPSSSTCPGGWSASWGRRRCTSASTRSTSTPAGSTSGTASSTSRRASTTGCSTTSVRPTASGEAGGEVSRLTPSPRHPPRGTPPARRGRRPRWRRR